MTTNEHSRKWRSLASFVTGVAALGSLLLVQTNSVRAAAATNGYIAYTLPFGSPGVQGATDDGKTVTANSAITRAPYALNDGSKIAWREQTNSTWKVKVGDPDGTNAITVIEGTHSGGPDAPSPVTPSLSPDGTKLLVTKKSGSNGSYTYDLYVVPVQAGQTFASLTPDVAGTGAEPSAVFISNTKYAYSATQLDSNCGFNPGVAVKEIGVSAKTFLPGSCELLPQTIGYLAASPDGQYVSYSFKATSSTDESIAINKTDGTGNRIDITTLGTGPKFQSAFSPDGTKFVYGYYNANYVGGGIGIAPWNGSTGTAGTSVALAGVTSSPSSLTWIPGNVSLSTTVAAPNPGSTATTAPAASATTTAPAATTTAPAATTAPAVTTTAPTTTVPAAIVAGQTVSDPTVYTTAPKKVSSQSAINVLTSTEARTQKIVSSTPAVCLPTKDEIVFIDEGRCSVSILNAKSGQVLRRMRTTVIDSDVVTLDIGNEVAVLAPIYFDGGSDKVNAAGTRRIRSLKAKIDAAGSVMVVGHSGTLMGDTPENREMSRNRATNTVKEMKRLGATGPFYSIGVGVADPADPTYSREAQNKNRRVVIVLVP